MKKRLQSLPRRRKQQSSFKREQIPETEKRTGDTAENCSYAYLRYLFARLYLTTLGNYAMVILLEQFYSFRDYGSLPGDGFILGPHIIPMRTKSKEARGGCVWNPCFCRRETCEFSFPADKNHQRGFGKKGAAHGENFLFFCRQERTGHFAKNPVQS